MGSWKDFLRGAARILDLGGTLNSGLLERYRQSAQSEDPWREDYLALRGDWEKVGEDMRKVIGK